MQLVIPCPNCGGNNYESQQYKVTFAILKDRVWHICRDCGYQKQLDKRGKKGETYDQIIRRLLKV